MRFGSRASAIEEAERLQGEFDADAEPSRVFVLEIDRVPIKAAGARRVRVGDDRLAAAEATARGAARLSAR